MGVVVIASLGKDRVRCCNCSTCCSDRSRSEQQGPKENTRRGLYSQAAVALAVAHHKDQTCRTRPPLRDVVKTRRVCRSFRLDTGDSVCVRARRHMRARAQTHACARADTCVGARLRALEWRLHATVHAKYACMRLGFASCASRSSSSCSSRGAVERRYIRTLTWRQQPLRAALMCFLDKEGN
eukprot:5433477-Pleurochrysis_carterae.AAC.1